MVLNRRKIVNYTLHVFGWIVIFILLQFLNFPQSAISNPLIRFSGWILIIGVFYLNYLILVPQLYLSKHLFPYLLVVTLILILTFLSIRLLFSHPHYGINSSSLVDLKNTAGITNLRTKNAIPSLAGGIGAIVILLILSIGTTIRVTQSLYLNEEKRKEIQNEKLSAELLFLKSQINPHFFFNTLNSIYYLAHIKSDQSPIAILKLSEIMRYIIYEAVKDKVPLSKEIDYIQNYIDLQRLRLNDNVAIEFVAHLGSNQNQIGPMLLIPFVENAFKHGIDYTQHTIVSISAIMEEENTLHFCVKNPNIQQNRVNLVSSGVGLQNVKKRLELLYPSNFRLSIQEDQLFTVDLYLNLASDELPYT